MICSQLIKEGPFTEFGIRQDYYEDTNVFLETAFRIH